MPKTNKIILLILLLLIGSFGILYAFNLLPFIKKETGLTDNNFINKTADEDRSVAIPTQKLLSSSPCLILDNELCTLGKPVYDSNKEFIGLGFTLPAGTKIYAPFNKDKLLVILN